MHIFHVFSTFAVGGPQVRTIQMMNAWGGRFRHTIFAMDGRYAAREKIAPGVPVIFGESSERGLRRVREIVRRVRAERPNLLLTYNWGAIEVALGAQLFTRCPVIHLEDGFGPDEAHGLKKRRVRTRRMVLRGAYATIVPSRTLYEIARNQYRLPERKIRYIPNGADTERFKPGRNLEWRERLGIAPDALVVGTIGALRPEKNLELLVHAFAAAAIPGSALVVIGEGNCRADLEKLADELKLDGRAFFPGGVADPAPCYGAFDIFAMSSKTEQMPMSLLEAMACGLPAICTDVGDSRHILDTPESPAIVPPGDVEAYAAALRTLAENPDLRARTGEGNYRRCVREYSFSRMLAGHGELYAAAARA